MITLYELAGKNDLRFSPPCWNVKLCLLYKNIDFETVAIGFSEKNKILFSNQQLVPVLKHQDGHISDSWNIINWLDENYENPKLFVNEASKNFSHFLYLWTSRQILPILFKIIAHEIPNILEGDDLNHYIITREERIKGPITKFVPVISDSIKKFRSLINPMRSLIKKNGFVSGSNPGIEDFIFFGNFKWVYTCSSCNLLDKEDEVFQWYKKINQIFNIETH
ncbi:MAG: glutathione S-transferase N-terminal domain-containing protein [Alphaproteobacteria bacterium]|nr:glutathione S-transferase N-terminal domain-containing protein [Alphaproteobacteria bacterium]